MSEVIKAIFKHISLLSKIYIKMTKYHSFSSHISSIILIFSFTNEIIEFYIIFFRTKKWHTVVVRFIIAH